VNTAAHAGAQDPLTLHALYYPYIHIRDADWLKGAVLAFQQVRRIVPNKFTVKDGAITRRYSELVGPAGPLLEPVFVDSQEIATSQRRLETRLRERLDDVAAVYAEDKVPPNLHGGRDAFEMHVGKFLDRDLLQLLMDRHLAWHSRESAEPDTYNWITMHPTFGAAMMSVLALSVARAKGLSVVTPNGRAHHELLANEEDKVFDRLIDVAAPPAATRGGGPGATVEELAHVVMTIGFDLTRLTPEQICELLKQGKDLRKFRQTLSGFASRIPSGLDDEERQRRLRHEAQAVLDEWSGYTRDLPAFAKESLANTAWDKVPDKLAEVVVDAAPGAATATLLGSLPGLAISVAVAAGVKMFRREDTPLRFLTRVNKMVDRSIGSIYIPQWRGLIGQQAV
jgi:hypothetical protein